MTTNTERLELFQVGPLPTNCYVIDGRYVVDPGGLDDGFEASLEDIQEDVEAILLTHTHWDHIAEVEAVRDRVGCPVLCHSEEFDMLEDPDKNFSGMQGSPISVEADEAIESVELPLSDGSTLEVLHTPGHSPGGVSFYWANESLVLSGDALFKAGVGRTDLPGSDQSQLGKSLRDVLLTLPDDTAVYPGHGPATTIGEEKRTNPFL